ncbi:hypothetical protein [Xylocopilactobacillus apis]|uniref:Uncharacterized protein n=1 Tax=Xylocopilactobacillus apis TaxID=2932183 RepID=A0AAU9DQD6_9LACO|nr:hypothetical protein [Xylocopilactobacillus apis]BDR55788.1 hypothetical protein KIMC2_03500 [Xylocopilactobacillus apis]
MQLYLLRSGDIKGLIGFIILAAIICGQIYLSRKQNKYLGFILPLVFFLFAASSSLGVAAFGGKESITTSSVVTEEGKTVSQETVTKTDTSNSELNPQFGIFIFLYANLFTFILIIIYLDQRRRIKQLKEIGNLS